MHRIDDEGATPQNGFTDGDVQSGTEATTVGEDWLNAVQEEIANVIEAAGIVLDKANNGQLLQALGGAAGGGLKNLLVNGDFSISQRNAPGGGVQLPTTEVPAYTLDRWVGAADGPAASTNGSMTRIPIPLADSRIGSEPNGDQANALWNVRCTSNNTTTADGLSVEQRVEGLIELAGHDVTFSIYADTETGFAITGRLEIWQHFGDGGSASPAVLVATQNINPGQETGYRRFVVTGTCPNLSGKTIDGNPSLRVRYAENVGFAFHDTYLALAQLERGSSPSPFDHRPASLELTLAQRYYEKSVEPDHDINSATFGGISVAYCPAGAVAVALANRFRTEKRAVPTMVWWDTNGNPGVISWGATLSVTGTDSSLSRVSTGAPICSPNGPLNLARGHWTADAEI